MSRPAGIYANLIPFAQALSDAGVFPDDLEASDVANIIEESAADLAKKLKAAREMRCENALVAARESGRAIPDGWALS